MTLDAQISLVIAVGVYLRIHFNFEQLDKLLSQQHFSVSIRGVSGEYFNLFT